MKYLLDDRDKYLKRLFKGKRGQGSTKNQVQHQKNLENYNQYLRYFGHKITQLKHLPQGNSIMTTMSDLKKLEI